MIKNRTMMGIEYPHGRGGGFRLYWNKGAFGTGGRIWFGKLPMTKQVRRILKIANQKSQARQRNMILNTPWLKGSVNSPEEFWATMRLKLDEIKARARHSEKMKAARKLMPRGIQQMRVPVGPYLLLIRRMHYPSLRELYEKFRADEHYYPGGKMRPDLRNHLAIQLEPTFKLLDELRRDVGLM